MKEGLGEVLWMPGQAYGPWFKVNKKLVWQQSFTFASLSFSHFGVMK